MIFNDQGVRHEPDCFCDAVQLVEAEVVGMSAPAITDQAVEIAADLCRRFEGLRLKPYLCPAGVPTVGYGSTRYGDGKPVSLKDAPITDKQADELLRLTLKRDYLPGLLAASPVLAERQQVLGALGSFAYNLGIGAYRTSTLRKRVDAGDWKAAQTELRRWVKSQGKVLPGLVKRREAEAELLASFLQGLLPQPIPSELRSQNAVRPTTLQKE